MRYRHFAPLDRDLSVLVLGTTLYRAAPPEQSTELLDAWLELGGNALDCGREYGESERVLGEWLARSGRRDDVVVLTKGAHQDEVRRRVTPADIGDDLRESLDVLGVDAIDIYMLHRDDPTQPVGPILEALNEHRRAGRIRSFGASNWTTARLDEAGAYARERELEGFSSSSPGLSLARQNEPPWPDCVAADDDASLAWYERTQLPLFAWSSQAGGYFAGIESPHLERVYGNAENAERLRRAADIGARTGRTATEIALAWVVSRPFPTYAIIGPRTVDELRRCVAALELELTEDELRWLDLEEDSVAPADRGRALDVSETR